MENTYFVIVASGIVPYRFPGKQIYRSIDAAMEAFTRWYQRVPNTGQMNPDSLMATHSIKIHEYQTLKAARYADIGDAPGQSGMIQAHFPMRMQ